MEKKLPVKVLRFLDITRVKLLNKYLRYYLGLQFPN